MGVAREGIWVRGRGSKLNTLEHSLYHRLDFLKKRALEMLTLAGKAFELGMYNLTLFNCEQAIQFYLKYLLAKRVGEYPKTHSIEVLLAELREIGVEPPALPNMVLDLLEEAYITARYLPKDYSKETAATILRSTEDYIRRLSEVERSI
jgi:HEPN domain-containing protein